MTEEEIRLLFSHRWEAVVHRLQFFADAHLPEDVRINVTDPLYRMTIAFVENSKDGVELIKALDRLIEAKDCMIRHYTITHKNDAR